MDHETVDQKVYILQIMLFSINAIYTLFKDKKMELMLDSHCRDGIPRRTKLCGTKIIYTKDRIREEKSLRVAPTVDLAIFV